jgi:hypothetical protein
MFRTVIAVYCERHTEQINTPCGENVDFMDAETDVACNYCCVLKASIYKVPGILKTFAPVENTHYVG